MSSNGGPALEVRDLRVLVGGVPAVHGIGFTLARGRRTAGRQVLAKSRHGGQ